MQNLNLAQLKPSSLCHLVVTPQNTWIEKFSSALSAREAENSCVNA
jgi:hypothetical protein